jgi:uncharacterized membrane protein YdcZ (DUF606 family)
MEKRWDSARPLALHTIATGIIVAASVLLLPALGLTLSVLARQVGVLIGEAVAAVVRDIFSAFGAFIPRHGFMEMRLPPLMGPFLGLAV